MPANKLQHYVPKAHLKPFSLGGEGKAVNMFAIKMGTPIFGAPTRGQCSRDYFYGKDLKVEKGLGEIEAEYGRIVSRIDDRAQTVPSEDLHALRDFALLQSMRTFGYIEKLMAVVEDHHQDMLAMTPQGALPPEGGPLPLSVAVMMALSHYAASLPIVADLRCCMIRNHSRVDFVTSDDPVVSLNRYYAQRRAQSSFGLSSTGLMMFMPLSPRLMFIAFDDRCYGTRKRTRDVIALAQDVEADALNELQFLHARSAVYFFRDWETKERVIQRFKASADRRPKQWHNLPVFEKVGDGEGREFYEKVEEIVPAKGKVFLTAIEQVHLTPQLWPQFLPYRHRIITDSTGSAAGDMRPGLRQIVQDVRTRREKLYSKARSARR